MCGEIGRARPPYPLPNFTLSPLILPIQINSSFLWLVESLSSVAIFFFFVISDMASSGCLPSSETPILIPFSCVEGKKRNKNHCEGPRDGSQIAELASQCDSLSSLLRPIRWEGRSPSCKLPSNFYIHAVAHTGAGKGWRLNR